jgi:hypothetical protein
VALIYHHYVLSLAFSLLWACVPAIATACLCLRLKKLFRSRIGLDRNSIFEIKWINYPRHWRQRSCRCIIRLIIQLDVTFSASWHVFLAFIFIWLNISTWMRIFFIKGLKVFRISDLSEFFIKTPIGSDSDQTISDRIGF